MDLLRSAQVLKEHCFSASELLQSVSIVSGGRAYNGLSKDSLSAFCVETTNKDSSVASMTSAKIYQSKLKKLRGHFYLRLPPPGVDADGELWTTIPPGVISGSTGFLIFRWGG